jgi:shikimate kinase
VSRRPLALVGFMGAGKSTTGKLVAAATGGRFLDLDEEIERRSGQSAADWIRERGETAFRDCERSVLEQILHECEGERGPLVLGCGGGAMVSAETRAILKSRTFCVWLDVPLEEALLRAGKQDRPLLPEKPEAARQLYEQRKSAYREAGARVDTSGRTPEDVAAEIAERWSPEGVQTP